MEGRKRRCKSCVKRQASEHPCLFTYPNADDFRVNEAATRRPRDQQRRRRGRGRKSDQSPIWRLSSSVCKHALVLSREGRHQCVIYASVARKQRAARLSPPPFSGTFREEEEGIRCRRWRCRRRRRRRKGRERTKGQRNEKKFRPGAAQRGRREREGIHTHIRSKPGRRRRH